MALARSIAPISRHHHSATWRPMSMTVLPGQLDRWSGLRGSRDPDGAPASGSEQVFDCIIRLAIVFSGFLSHTRWHFVGVADVCDRFRVGATQSKLCMNLRAVPR